MILQALVRYYEDLLEQGKISKPGWGSTRVSFALNLDKNGEVLNLISLKIPKEKGGKTVYEAKDMEVPQPVKRSVDIRPNFLCDNSTYVLGIDEKGKPDRSRQCFEAFRDLHIDLLGELAGQENTSSRAVLNFLKNWKPEQGENCVWFSENRKELMAGANIVFYCEGKAVTEDAAVREVWQKHYDSGEKGEEGICMVTGRKTRIADLHPVIKGVYGAQAMGTSLVSFNAPAFCSYGKEQGRNAAVGEYAATAYGAALNDLLGDREHTRSIGDTTVVFWAEGAQSVYQDIGLAAMFGSEDDGKITDQDLTAIFDRAGRGEFVELDGVSLDMDRHFYILGVAPNAARLSVRFFLQDSFGNVLKNIKKHYDRLEIVKPSEDKREKLSLRSLLWETVNQKSKDKSVSPQMAADTLKAILTGGTYPASLLNGVMLRIRAEHAVTRGRAAIIKAYYLRNENKQFPKEVLKMALNEESTNPYYVLGRLFAVLEQIQQEANRDINTTIKDKYFNSAAATPAQIFPLLVNLSQKHLRKLTEKRRIALSQKMEEIMAKLGESYPGRMTLPQQGAFHLGYYHQTQKRYQKKEEQ